MYSFSRKVFKAKSTSLISFSFSDADRTEEIIYVEGNVVVTNSEGSKLLSEELIWFSSEEKITATGNVKISKDDMRAFGDFAYADNNFKHFGLMGNAKILKGVKEGETF